MNNLHESFSAGYACLSAWSELLDRINVFPVADGDTGTNLRISLAPLRNPADTSSELERRLALCATGNSGNIAAAFFQEFSRAQSFKDLVEYSASGREKAWQAIAEPCRGTMLSVFDSLVSSLASRPAPESVYEPLCSAMQEAVVESMQLLPHCQKAGVVDSGALAMYLFFDGFFSHLTARPAAQISPLEIFSDKLAISKKYRPKTTDHHCIDVVVQKGKEQEINRDSLARLGESMVVVEDESTSRFTSILLIRTSFMSIWVLLVKLYNGQMRKLSKEILMPHLLRRTRAPFIS
jgi:dihydroxyacetone kinase-like predicted kinase